MLTVNRIYINSVIFCKLHNNMTRCYKCLLVGKCNILMCFYCLYSRNNAHHTYNSCKYYICALNSSCLNKTFIAIYYLYINIRKLNLKLICKLFTSYAHKLRLKLPYLLFKVIHPCTCCKCNNLYIIISSYNI